MAAAGPETVVAEIEAIAARVSEIAATDREGWTPLERSEHLLALLGLQERVTAAATAATGEWDRREDWRRDGSLTPAAWLRGRGVPDRRARHQVRAGRFVARHPGFAKALATGDLGPAHIDAVAAVAIPARADLFDQHADAMLDVARDLPADDFASVCRRWAAYADDELQRGDPERLHGRRGVWMDQVGDMVQGRFVGDPAELAALRTVLDRIEPPDPASTPGGARTLAQRRYDALVRLAHLGNQDGGGRVDSDHTITVVIDAATLAGAFDPSGRSELLDGTSVLPARVRQLLCDSRISRVLLGPRGEVLDLGRTARLFTPAQKRAIQIRDRGCAIEGCDRPTDWCDVHHLDPYGPPTHGETNLDNGISICRPHHTLVHRGWTARRQGNGRWCLEPP